jgi:putative transposase
MRYVVLNPVRAGMVADVSQWRWSSYAATLGNEPRPPWLQTDWILAQFSQKRGAAIMQYVDFVRAGIGLPSLWKALRGQVFLGSETFMHKMQQAVPEQAHIAEIPRAQRRAIAMPLTSYRDSIGDQKAAMAAAYASGDYTMQEIADCFGVHYATVSRAVASMRGCKT